MQTDVVPKMTMHRKAPYMKRNNVNAPVALYGMPGNITCRCLNKKAEDLDDIVTQTSRPDF